MNKDKDYAKIKYRVFFLSFSAAFFVLAVTFLLLVTAVRPVVPDSLAGESEIGDESSVYTPTGDEAFTVLLVGGGAAGPGAGMFMLARFDPVAGKIPVIALPPETAVANLGKMEKLSEVYQYGGAKYLKEALGETLGVPVDRYLKLNLETFLAAAEMVGYVEFDLPYDVSVLRSGVPNTLTKGKQLLDGQKAADVMLYGGYPGGESERLRIAAGLVCEIINQRMDICLSTVAEDVFEKIINMVSTDISYSDYFERKQAAEFMARLGEKPAYRLQADGEWSADRSMFVLSDTFIAGLSQTMRS